MFQGLGLDIVLGATIQSIQAVCSPLWGWPTCHAVFQLP